MSHKNSGNSNQMAYIFRTSIFRTSIFRTIFFNDHCAKYSALAGQFEKMAVLASAARNGRRNQDR